MKLKINIQPADVLILAVVVLLICWFLCNVQEAEGAPINQWTKSAPHHKAACVVTVQNPDETTYSGSGVYVQVGSVRGVLTCAHLFGKVPQSACVTFSDGSQQCGRYTTDRYKHDVAFVFLTHPGINPLSVSRTNPRVGDAVEFVTFGGPRKRDLRHFSSRVKSAGTAITTYDNPVIVGDSGGAILNTDRQVVGIQTGGFDAIGQSKGHRIYRYSVGPALPHIRAFTTRVYKRARSAESGNGGSNTQSGYYRQCLPCQQGGLFNRQQVIVTPPAYPPAQQRLPEINEADLYPPANQSPQILDSTPPIAQQPVKPCDCEPQTEELAQLRAQLAQLQIQLNNQQYNNEPKPKPEPEPTPVDPAPPGANVSIEDMSAMRAELAALKSRISQLSERPIVFEYLDGEGKVAHQKSFPGGRPIQVPPNRIQLLDQQKRVIDSKSYPVPNPIKLQGIYSPAKP